MNDLALAAAAFAVLVDALGATVLVVGLWGLGAATLAGTVEVADFGNTIPVLGCPFVC